MVVEPAGACCVWLVVSVARLLASCVAFDRPSEDRKLLARLANVVPPVVPPVVAEALVPLVWLLSLGAVLVLDDDPPWW